MSFPVREYWQNGAKVRCLLRALLRECSYLPDSHSRVYLSNHVLDRFKEYKDVKALGGPARDGKLGAEQFARLKSIMDTAKQELRNLRRANDGDRDRLLKVLLHTYGRSGKRRHLLLKPLFQPDGPESIGGPLPKYRDEEYGLPGLELVRVLHIISRDDKGTVVGIHPNYGILTALLDSHIRAEPNDFNRTQMKGSKQHDHKPVLTIASKNVWLRPMPRIREKNQIKKWYATLLDKILPPLEEAEWQDLKAKATGMVKWEGSRERRTAAKALHRDAEDQGDDVGPPFAPFAEALNDAPRVKHNLWPNTQKLMQQLWRMVFDNSPVMRWDSAKQRWNVEWGCEVLRELRRKAYHAPLHTGLFEGVAESGKSATSKEQQPVASASSSQKSLDAPSNLLT